MKEPLLSYKQFDFEGNMQYISPELKALCRRYRKNLTNTEDIIWQCLRNRKLGGYKFLRQHPIGGYIVDFYCHAKRLIVEIDGGIHNRKDIREKDEYRQKFLENNEYKMIRCTNSEVKESLEGVLERLLKKLKG